MTFKNEVIIVKRIIKSYKQYPQDWCIVLKGCPKSLHNEKAKIVVEFAGYRPIEIQANHEELQLSNWITRIWLRVITERFFEKLNRKKKNAAKVEKQNRVLQQTENLFMPNKFYNDL